MHSRAKAIKDLHGYADNVPVVAITHPPNGSARWIGGSRLQFDRATGCSAGADVMLVLSRSRAV